VSYTPSPPLDPAAARLTGARSQRAFSALLDTLARPGTIRSLDSVGLPDDVPTALVVPLALADVEVSVAIADDRWQRFLVDVTGCRIAAPTSAAMVVFLDPPDRDSILSLRRGNDESPEGGAKVAIAVDRLRPHVGAATDADELVVELSGPGVDGSCRLAIAGLPAAALDAIATANRGFPSGIDTWLVARDGSIAALSRSTHIALADLTEVR
jgi:alpha-D-ribose 1-methylphosphonate 5-triphosphate synthase subunit PhnH